MWIKFKAYRWTYDDLARRLTDLLYGSKIEMYRLTDTSNQRWSLGSGNNVWLHKIEDLENPDNPFYELHFRYIVAPWIPEAIKDSIQNSGEYFMFY